MGETFCNLTVCLVLNLPERKYGFKQIYFCGAFVIAGTTNTS